MKGLDLHRFEARVRFTTEAELPLWSGNSLRSGFGLRLREMVCANPAAKGGDAPLDDCAGCCNRERCVYDHIYNSRPPEGASVLKKQSEIPRPFVLDPPAFGRYGPGQGAALGFTLFGKNVELLPYFILALRNLGEGGLGKGYRLGRGKYEIELIDSVGLDDRECIYSGGVVFNRARSISYDEILRRAEGFRGQVTLRFITPSQIKENDRFTTEPSFRGLVSRLLFRANALAEFHGTGMLYDNQESLRILGYCREVEMARSKTSPVYQERYFRDQGKKAKLPPFFVGEIAYSGEFSAEVVALLRLGEVIHMGKMATFGNGRYQLEESCG